jgi:hypothetical protein
LLNFRSLFLIGFVLITSLHESQSQCNNLLENGDASAGLTDWSFSSGAGQTWELQNHGFGDAFVSSYEWCTMEQTIDLIGLGFTAQYLDQSPPVSFSQMFKGRYDFSGDSLDSYYYHIELLDTSSQIIDSLYFGSQGNPIITTNSWDTVYGGFFGYGPGLRYIRVECGGNDAEGWLGNYKI